MSKKRLDQLITFNPSRPIKKGVIASFIDMAALPINSRDIPKIGSKLYKGGGARFSNGDTLFSRITPCLENGKTAKVSGLLENVNAHGSTEFIVMSAIYPEFDEDFIYYIARLPEFRAFAKSRMEGTSGRQRVSWQAIADFEFDFPSKEGRKRIGSILARLDDKIKLNHQTNQTLEQIAQAIFKCWFVDFEPVKAKQHLHKLGGNKAQKERAAQAIIAGAINLETIISATDLDILDQQISQVLEKKTAHQTETQRQQLVSTASYFPNELIESELGLIPEGWNVSSLGNDFDIVMGQSPPGDTYNENEQGIAFFQGRRDFGWRYPTNRVYCTQPKRMASKGDTLLSVRAPVGDINKASSDCCIGRGISALRHITTCEAYTYYLLLNLSPIFENFSSEGTVFGSINQKNLKTIKIIRPSHSVLNEFSKITRPVDEQIENLDTQTRILSKIRDTLLPKLLSGEFSMDAKT